MQIKTITRPSLRNGKYEKSRILTAEVELSQQKRIVCETLKYNRADIVVRVKNFSQDEKRALVALISMGPDIGLQIEVLKSKKGSPYEFSRLKLFFEKF